MHQPVKNTAYGPDGATPKLWDRILGLIEQDLEERRSRKLFVKVQDESGSSCEKEIGGALRGGTPEPAPGLARTRCGATT